MINNANAGNNLNSYILMANHCTKDFAGADINFGNLSVRFKYWQGNSSYITFPGTYLRARSADRADFAIVELVLNPSPANKIFYLGWTKTSNSPTSSTIIHHEQGGTMKIATDIQTAASNTGYTVEGVVQDGAWVLDLTNTTSGDFGDIQDGSSGATLINQNHKIQGNLIGSPPHSGCPGPNDDSFYGKFNVSWDGNGTSTTRLKDWLDPANTNPQEILSTFKILDGTTAIPCANLNQDVSAPLLQTNSGTKYTYTWVSSSNITFTGSGEAVTFKAINSQSVGSTEWIECEIRTPTACGNQLIARSARKNLTWIDQTGAFIKATNTSNGQVIGTVTAIPLNNCRTYNISFESIPVPNAVSFNWSFTGNTSSFYNSISNSGKTITICCYGSGSITANVQVVNGSGCLVGTSKNYAFTQGSWLVNPDETNLASIEEEQSEKIEIFPNPTAQDNTILHLPQSINPNTTIITVSDLYGRILDKRKPDDIYHEIDISYFVNGIYFIEVNDGNYHYSTRFVVKK
jgi:hypothetical protein